MTNWLESVCVCVCVHTCSQSKEIAWLVCERSNKDLLLCDCRHRIGQHSMSNRESRETEVNVSRTCGVKVPGTSHGLCPKPADQQ